MVKIKRIIDGKTYNTETASLVHTVDLDEKWSDGEVGLYQTKHGAFFWAWEDALREELGVKPASDEEAQKWLEKHEATAALEKFFGEFPDAGAAESRITLRLPGNLHKRVAAAATAAGLSLNTYIMRLLERSESQTAVQSER